MEKPLILDQTLGVRSSHALPLGNSSLNHVRLSPGRKTGGTFQCDIMALSEAVNFVMRVRLLPLEPWISTLKAKDSVATGA